MAKYKICPVCGEHNEPYMLECSKCETDLSSTRVLDEDTEKAQSEQNSKENVSSSTAKMIRLCDCGFKNPVQSRKCQSCGEDISMVVPSPDEAETEETNKFIISSLDDRGTETYHCTPVSIYTFPAAARIIFPNFIHH